MKYIVYIRVSTGRQALGRDTQIKMCEDYCKRLGAEVAEVFIDDGLCGELTFSKRPGLLNAIASLSKNDILLVAKRDRLSRGDQMSMAMIESAVQRKSAEIISVAGEGSDSNDPSAVLMRRMVDAFAEYELLLIRSRTRNALATKRSRNERCGYIPFGKKLQEDNIHLEPCEEEQLIVDEIMALHELGFSFRKIATEMNENGWFNRDLKLWNCVTIFNLVKKNEIKNEDNI